MAAKTQHKVLSTDVLFYLDTSEVGSSTPTFKLFGQGIEECTSALNPETDESKYIIDKQTTTTKTGVNPQWSFTGDRILGDEAQDFIVGLAYKLGSEVERDLVIVEKLKPVTGKDGYYEAYKQNVAVMVDNDGLGGTSTDPMQIEGMFSGKGDKVDGYFNITTFSFTESIPESSMLKL